MGSSRVSGLSDTLTPEMWLALIMPLACAQALPHKPVPGHILRPDVDGLLSLVKV